MPRPCTICTHPQRKAIDKAIVAGESMASIAGRYSTESHPLGGRSLQRHKEDHIPATLAKAKDAKEVSNADNLLDEVRKLQKITHGILGKAIQAEDLRTALAAIREARGNTELLAKLLGELNDNPQINVIINPQWIELRTVIVQALKPYPEARQAVAKVLEGMESRG